MSNIESLIYFIPEWVLIAMMLVLIVVDIAAKKSRDLAAPVVAMAAFVLFFIANLVTLLFSPTSLFEGMITFDFMGIFFKGLVAVVAMLVVVLSYKSNDLKNVDRPTYYLLLIAAVLGMDLLIVSKNLLMIYLALEMVSIPSYLLSGSMRGDKKSSEAALKYVIYGGVASGVMVYGMSWIYGITGELGLFDVYIFLTSNPVNNVAIFIALLFTIAGFLFKVASVPFHMWCPDVYEGSPTPITAFLSVGPKAAGFAILIRFLTSGFMAAGENGWEVVGGVTWPALIAILSAATMTWGNFAALRQENLKRLLAYSSIAHAGYILMGLAAFSPRALSAVFFYLVIYVAMNIGAFLVVIMMANQTGSFMLESFRGLGRRGTYGAALAVAMTVFLFSLTGMPPLAGFAGKFYLFSAVMESKLYWLALVGVLNSVVSLYYYARVVKTMFLDEAEAGEPVAKPFMGHSVVVAVLAALIVYLGIFWNQLVYLTSDSVQMIR